MKKILIGLYLTNEVHGIVSCSRKLLQSFDVLEKCDASLGLWYETTRPKKGQPVEPLNTKSEIGVKNLLALSRNYNDNGTLDEDLGCIVYLKSRKDFSKSHVLSAILDHAYEKITNCFTLELNLTEADIEYMDLYEKFKAIWKPRRSLIERDKVVLLSETFDV